MNKIKYLFLTVSALAFTACNTDNIGAIYKGEDGVASFAQSVLNDNEVAIAATEYYVPVLRQTNVGDLTVNFTSDPLKGNMKQRLNWILQILFLDKRIPSTSNWLPMCQTKTSVTTTVL